jgi:hypothetical protein
MRLLRVLVGVIAILVALPLLLGGVALWAAMRHRAPDGSFRAHVADVRTDGYAVVVPDVDALLRREAPFARGGETTLRVTARTATGPAFVGLAPRAAVGRYLSGVAHADVTEVRLARGGLPVSVSQVPGTQPPAGPPAEQPFWVSASASGNLAWSPSAVRGQPLALVVMGANAEPALQVTATASVTPSWLDPTAWGLLVLGTVAFLLGMVLLFWPRRQREVVYVVEPSQVPEVAARLGLSTEPLAHAIGTEPDPFDLLQPIAEPPPEPTPEPAPEPTPEPEPEPAAGPVIEQPAWLVEQNTVTAPAVSPPPAPITPSFVWPPIPPAPDRTTEPVP